jgi:hypothetical protein
MTGRAKSVKIEHEMSGNRRARKENNIPEEMPEGLVNALEKVKELNEAETTVKEISPEFPELRDLVFFGKIKEKVTIGNYIFELNTLTNKQQRSLISKLVKMDGEDRLLNIKPMTLSEALVSVNGLPLEELYMGGDEDLSILDARLEVIYEMQSTLVERLFNEYERINKKSTDLTSSKGLEEQIKN